MSERGKELRTKLLTLANLEARPDPQKLPSGYVMLFMRSNNIVYGNTEGSEATILDTNNIIALNNIIPIVGNFDSTGKLEIEIPDAHLYGVIGAIQDDPGGLQTSYRRLNPSNTSTIEIQADAGQEAEGIQFFGLIALLPT